MLRSHRVNEHFKHFFNAALTSAVVMLRSHLDDKNPRHDIINDQQKIIEYLLRDEQVKPLAKDISIHGLNPIELPAIFKDEEGRYVALEGNRRLCSSKLLIDPDKAPEGSKAHFKKLAQNAKIIPNQVLCVIFNNRDAADVWLDRRHNGQQGGIGIKSWDAEQQNRRNLKNKKSDENALAQTLLDYARERGFLTNKEKKIVTTAARYLGNPVFRRCAGIVSGRSDANVEINVGFDEFDIFLNAFCEDLSNTSKNNKRVSSRSTKEDWIAYAETLKSEGKVPITIVSNRFLSQREQYIKQNNGVNNSSHSDETYDTNHDKNSSPIENVSDVNKSTVTENVQEKTNPRGTKNPDTRKFIIPNDFRPKISNAIIRRAFQELISIEVDEYPLAVGLVMRAFLENIYLLFYEKSEGVDITKTKTHNVIQKVIDIIQEDSQLSKTEKNALAGLRRLGSDSTNALSPSTLGINAHAALYPDARQLKREFDNIASIINYMIKKL